MLTANEFSSALNYEPSTGLFHWKSNVGRARKGCLAGTINQSGYVLISVSGRKYRAHRIAWLMTHGVWPTADIDHVNGVRDDNRITNLREASRSENNQNMDSNANSSSRFLGVSWNSQKRHWRAQICVQGKRLSLGNFKSEEDAHAAYAHAKSIHHAFNPVHRQDHAGALREAQLIWPVCEVQP